jgi:hypothetical protein
MPFEGVFMNISAMTSSPVARYNSQVALSQVDFSALRAIAAGGVEAALRSGFATHEAFKGFEVDVRRIDQAMNDDEAHPATTAVRCVISQSGTMIESHEWIVSESMTTRFTQARD